MYRIAKMNEGLRCTKLSSPYFRQIQISSFSLNLSLQDYLIQFEKKLLFL